MTQPEILISTGEASGDMYAAPLATALAQRTRAHLFGFGGQRMREAGVELVADYSSIAVMGISEVVHRMPAAWKIMRLLEREVARRRPALVILVGSPSFNLPLTRRLRHHGVGMVYFISPQVWAWRRWRVRIIKQRIERMLVIFPFEEPFYRQYGMPVDFVGHPLVDIVRPSMTRQQFAAKYGLDGGRPIVTLLPGSRVTEVLRHLPLMLQACERLARDLQPQFVLAAAPGLDPSLFDRDARASVPVRRVEGATYDALAAADCAIVASGTATVEAALLGTPMVVVYRVSPTTAAIARRIVRTSFFSMVNLMMGRQIVPELIQDDFTVDAVEAEVRRLLNSTQAREQMKCDLAEMRTKLGPGGAIERAAEIIAALLVSRATGQLPDRSLVS